MKVVSSNQKAALEKLEDFDNAQNFFLFLRMDLMLDDKVEFSSYFTILRLVYICSFCCTTVAVCDTNAEILWLQHSCFYLNLQFI